MKLIAVILCIVCQLLLVIGQIVLKHTMNATGKILRPWPKILRGFAFGIGLLTLWFFLWLGLLAHLPLSKIFPFEGLNPALLVLGAWIFLKEKLTPATLVGMALLSAGILLVSNS